MPAQTGLSASQAATVAKLHRSTRGRYSFMGYDGQAIVLIGFMGAGKSSVGRRLEKSTRFRRFDTDEMIAAKFGLSVPRIFEVHGEDVFRDAESEILRQLNSREPSIIVTGGGIVLRTTHRELLRQLGTVVYLQADEE